MKGNKKSVLILAVSLFALLSEARAEEVIAIRGGRILTMAGRTIERGTVLVRDGRIAAVGERVDIPAGATLIEAEGKIIMPGMIDSNTRIGLDEIDLVSETRDDDEATDPVTPQLRVIDAFHVGSDVIPVTRVNGITSVVSVPAAGNPISGQSALVRLYGRTLDEMLIKAPAALHFNFGEPPRRYGQRNQTPMTRMGIAAVIRQALAQARDYMEKQAEYQRRIKEYQERKARGDAEAREPSPPERDLKMEALAPALRGEVSVVARAERLDDIETAIRIAEEFSLKLILSHASDAYKIADRLAAKKIPVLVGPITTQPETIEKLGAIYENAARLAAAGVKIAIQTADVHNVRNLPYQAGLAAAYGLPLDKALRAITISPAEILGVAERIGSIEVGKDADILVVEGDIIQPLSKVTHVLIKGKLVPLTNRQTELYEKYK